MKHEKKEHGKNVGPCSERSFRNPFDNGEDEQTGSDDQKTLLSPSSTPTGIGIEKHDSYDTYWEGK